MPKTFQQLYEEVVYFVQKKPDNTEAVTNAKTYINDGITKLNTKEWDWRYTTSGITLQVDTREYPLPTDFLTQRTLNSVNPAGLTTGYLGFLDPKLFDRQYSAGTVNYPTTKSYTIHNPYVSGMIELSFAPDTAYLAATPTLELGYYARIPQLVTSGEMLNIPEEAESVVSWYAKSSMCALYGDDTRLQMAETRWREGWKSITKQQLARQAKDWR